MKDHYRIDELAAKWDVAQRTIRRLIQRGEITAVKVGDTWRISQTEIQRFELENTSRLNSPPSAVKL